MLITRNGDRNFGPVGVDGVDFCGLRMNDMEGGAAVIRMKKGVRFPTHTRRSDERDERSC
ncbi:MAG: hypothetical protein ACJ0SL_01840 [Candidatus Rariloculaceae bacterium]